MKKGIYLAKSGKIFGPFTQKDVDDLHSSGQIQTYSWMWKEEKNQWQALDPAPSHSPHQPAKTSSSSISAGWEAICHNFKQIISGTLDTVTEMGCEIITQDRSAMPVLGQQAIVMLNLLEPKSGKCMNVKAQVAQVSKSAWGWVYRIKWNGIPETA